MQINLSAEEIKERIRQNKTGIADLQGYITKLKKNIKIFEDAMDKEKAEIHRTRSMIAFLKGNNKDLKSILSKKTVK